MPENNALDSAAVDPEAGLSRVSRPKGQDERGQDEGAERAGRTR